MKKKLSFDLLGKFLTGLLAIVLIITGILFMKTDSSDVIAADSAQDFFAEEWDISAYRSGDTYTYPKPKTSGKEGYLFAGWYTDKSCDTAYTITTIEGVKTAWAKYVPAETLEVKFQATEGLNEQSESSNLRIVSTVDSTNYSKVGFKILSLLTGAEKTTESTEVYKRIKSNTEGLEYGYSPVIFDIDSEYFVTVTLTNLKDFDRTYSARAYWVTLDGTEVVGTARNVKVSDSYNKIANVPVRLYTDDNVTASDVTVTYDTDDFTFIDKGYELGSLDSETITVTTANNADGTTKLTLSWAEQTFEKPDGMLVNLRFKIKDSASSTERFAVSSDSIAGGLYDYIYHVYSPYDASKGADTSWYDEFTETETDLVIATGNDLYGLAEYANKDSIKFSGKTIYLGSDIVINTGEIKDWLANATDEDSTNDPYEWTPISYNTGFKGNFEGQGNTISGIYLIDDEGTSAHGMGLFGQTAYGTTVRDFQLKNSYFESKVGNITTTQQAAIMGSVIGHLCGDLDTVYSDAIIVSAFRQVGGIVGRAYASKDSSGNMRTNTIMNCWFDGSLTVTEESLLGKYGGVGGILGRNSGGKIEISDCLNTANITYSFNEVNEANASDYVAGVGGIAGDIGSPTSSSTTGSITNCMNAGGITVNRPSGETKSKKNCANISYRGTLTDNVDATDSLATYNGYKGYTEAKDTLVFYDWDTKSGYWVCRETSDTAINGIPVLKSFCDAWIDVSWYYDDTSSDEFTISHAEELYGLSEITNLTDTNFDGKTVKLGADIKLNSGVASVWASYEDKTQIKAREFTPISGTSKSTVFSAEFDGQGHTISGMYISQDVCTESAGFIGLFSRSNKAIRNLSLTNSYIDSTKQYTGSIVGYYTSSMTSVYSDAWINNTFTNSSDPTSTSCITGGLVGGYGSTLNVSISNSWFAGNINVVGMDVGGIVGLIDRGTKTISNCLNTGTITTSDTHAGGIVGWFQYNSGNAKKLTISNCINAGTLNYPDTIQADNGSILGYTNGTVVFKNVYSIENKGCAEGIPGVGNSVIILDSDNATNITGQPAILTLAELKGTEAYKYTELDLASKSENTEGVWVAKSDGVPQLNTFSDSDVEETFNDVQKLSTDWYYNNTLRVGSSTLTNPADQQTTFIIQDADDMFGLAELVNNGKVKFVGDTIKLGADIEFNDATAEGTEAKEWYQNPETAPTNSWVPIGTTSNKFDGIFDGDEHTISGVYCDYDTKYMGLFGVTHEVYYENVTLSDGTTANVVNGDVSEVKNFRLRNSYFKQTKADSFVGSIAAEICGNLSNVYSDAIISGTALQTGGIAARVNGRNYTHTTEPKIAARGIVNITNCCFDGEIHIDIPKKSTYVGGVVGSVVQGEFNMTNALFDGTIDTDCVTYGSIHIGGLCADVRAQNVDETETNYVYLTYDNSTGTVTIEDDGTTKVNLDACSSTGTVTSVAGSTNTKVGSVFGLVQDYARVNMVDHTVVYTTSCYPTPIGSGTVTGYAFASSGNDRLLGYMTQTALNDSDVTMTCNLPFGTNGWMLRTNGTPIPEALSDVFALDVIASPDNKVLAKEIGLDYWDGESATLATLEYFGGGKYLKKYTTTDSLTYDGYLSKLATLGFVSMADNTNATTYTDGIKTATYYKAASGTTGEWVITVSYVDKLKEIYISVNTDVNSIAPSLSSDSAIAQADGTNAVSLSMTELLSTERYGNGFIYQLANGHFIISDGGNDADTTRLFTYLKELAGTKDGKQNPVYIDAWIITHFHGDHMGALRNLYSTASYNNGLIKDVYLDALYVNEPSDRAATHEKDQKLSTVKGIRDALRGAYLLRKADGVSRPDVYQMHLGQRFHFNGVTVDVIDTQEQHRYDTWTSCNDPDLFNTTSTSCIFTLTATGDKVFMGGDANKVNMTYIMNAFDNLGISIVRKDINTAGTSYRAHTKYDDIVTGTVRQTTSATMKDISVYVSTHHGKNTVDAFTTYLFGTEDASNDKLEVILVPYNQQYQAVHKDSYLASNGQTFTDCYWMEDESSVFCYDIYENNQKLFAKADAYYTFGYEDSVTGATEENPHGTVRLTFGDKIQATVLKSWSTEYTTESFSEE